MGLDMYLTKKIFIGAEYEHRKITGNIEVFQNGKPIKINFNKVSYIEESVAYWRKANAIHKWFVDNVQGGEDNCGSYYVSEDDFKSLLDDINFVLNDTSSAEAVLPTTNGVFFGGTEYDEWYFKDLKYTKEVVESILSEEEHSADYYHSSW
jgi:hypothetical protein